MEFKLHHKIHTPEKQPFLSALSHYNLKGCFTPPFWSHRGIFIPREGTELAAQQREDAMGGLGDTEEDLEGEAPEGSESNNTSDKQGGDTDLESDETQH